ncbi:MAG: hypothetical protein K2O05_01965 [Anaeroplasmataceae bacterium]|nr:hypothetical protein [Anaeroplasmataceae bacterium]
MENTYEAIFCIVNAGFADDVMVAARACGAGGGTVLSARGTAKEEAEKIFNISIQPEKEIILILARNDIKDDILHSIYKNVGLSTPGQGIAFSVPVNQVVGIGGVVPPVQEEPVKEPETDKKD